LVDTTNNIYKCYHVPINSSDVTKYQYIIISNFNSMDTTTLELRIDNISYILKKM